MSEQIIKENDYLTVSIDINRGYLIRLKGYKGSVFTVTPQIGIEVGQSSRMTYNSKVWSVLLAEIEEGKKYMTKVKLSGGFPSSVAKRQQTIKPSQYVENCLYKDIKGRFIFYIGKARELKCGNRIGCDYLYGVLSGNSIDIQVIDNAIHIFTSLGFRFDSYINKPSKLVEYIKSFPRDINTIVIHHYNGEMYYCFQRYE